VVAPADLTGVWALDNSAGQRGPSMRGGGMGGGMGGRGGMGGGRGGMGGGRGGMGGGRGGMPQGGERGGEGDRGRRAPGDSTGGRMAPPARLTISQDDSSVTVRRGNEAPLTLFFDGRTITAPGRGGDSTTVSGHWHKTRYETTRQVGDMTILESFERSKDRMKLTVRTKIQNGDRTSPEVTRTYDWQRRE
jgi:hypothetical protein